MCYDQFGPPISPSFTDRANGPPHPSCLVLHLHDSSKNVFVDLYIDLILETPLLQALATHHQTLQFLHPLTGGAEAAFVFIDGGVEASKVGCEVEIQTCDVGGNRPTCRIMSQLFCSWFHCGPVSTTADTVSYLLLYAFITQSSHNQSTQSGMAF